MTGQVILRQRSGFFAKLVAIVFASQLPLPTLASEFDMVSESSGLNKPLSEIYRMRYRAINKRYFYRAMHFSANRGIAILILSVCYELTLEN